MRILFISDIHGIYINLRKIEGIIKDKNIDKLVVLGDLYYRGFNKVDNLECDNFIVREFLERYRDKLIVIRGNCDCDYIVSYDI